MGFRVISKEALGRMVRSLQQQQYRVVGPKPVAGEYIFAEIESPDDGALALHLDYTQTVVPPKKYLLPQHEEVARFNLDGSVIAPVLDAPPTVILGIHTCDLHALQLLDKVFEHRLRRSALSQAARERVADRHRVPAALHAAFVLQEHGHAHRTR